MSNSRAKGLRNNSENHGRERHAADDNITRRKEREKRFTFRIIKARIRIRNPEYLRLIAP